jgi:hypothetical protein
MSLSFIQDETIKNNNNKTINKSMNSNISKKKKRELLIEKMNTTLEEGLSSSISETNKGYKLLSKFGYNPECGLGKHGQGIKEPISIIKNDLDNYGIGLIEEQNKKKLKTIHEKEMLETQFINTLKTERIKKLDIKDLYQAKKCIMELDIQHNISYHNMWPKNVIENTDNKCIEISVSKAFEMDDYCLYDNEDYKNEEDIIDISIQEEKVFEIKDNVDNDNDEIDITTRLMECIDVSHIVYICYLLLV